MGKAPIWNNVRKKVAKVRARGRVTSLLAAGFVGMLAMIGAGWAFVAIMLIDAPQVPSSGDLWSYNREPGVTYLDRNGNVLAVRGPYYGRAIKSAELPRHVVQAFLAAEDSRFFEHSGIDHQALIRAATANLEAGHTVQGGSTITQQLVKNLFLTPDRTMKRKVQEVWLAWQIERRLSKDEILDLYLNRVFLGENSFGVDAASRRLFGKSAMELSLSEAAVLAGLPKAPTKYSPRNNYLEAKQRQKVVLARMAAMEYLTPAQALAAGEQPLPLAAAAAQSENLDFGWLIDVAQGQLPSLSPRSQSDLVVRLSFDQDLQSSALQAVRANMEAVGKGLNANQAALVAIDANGAIRAMVGGLDYAKSKYNRATQAQRQPGSSFKTFVYAAALEAGLTPNSVRVDGPTYIRGWSPRNYGLGYAGPMTLRTALTHSINTVAAKLAEEVGQTRVVEIARRFGVASPLEPRPTIALGADELTLMDMTRANGVLMRGGYKLEPYLIEQIETSKGDVIYTRPKLDPVRVYASSHASALTSMLSDVVTKGTGTRARLPGRESAGKTGTSQNWRDAWYVGFTADFVTGVWVGNDDFRPMRKVTGGSLPAAIWADFMSVAQVGLPARGLYSTQPETIAADTNTKTAYYAALSSQFSALAGEDLALAPALFGQVQ